MEPFQSKLGQIGLGFIARKQQHASWATSSYRKTPRSEIRAMFGPRGIHHTITVWDKELQQKQPKRVHRYHEPAFAFDEVIHALDRRRTRALQTDDPMHLWDAVSSTFSEKQLRDALTGYTAATVIGDDPSDEEDDLED